MSLEFRKKTLARDLNMGVFGIKIELKTMGLDKFAEGASTHWEMDQHVSARGISTLVGWGQEEKPAKKIEEWPVIQTEK